MKCVFTVGGSSQEYIEMVKTFVVSAYTNGNRELICVYDGTDQRLVDTLQKWGVEILPWRVSFLEKIKQSYTGAKSIDYCVGAYLCIEVPRVLRYYGILDTYVLYLDIDMLVLDEIETLTLQPTYFAAPPDWDINDWSFASTGALIMNVEQLIKHYQTFVEHLHKHNFNFAYAGHGPTDQGAWNTFYGGLWDRLRPEYDWKPWWGYDPSAKIIHFAGPKPHEIQSLLDDPIEKDGDPERRKINLFVVNQNPDAYRHYLKLWRKYRRMLE